MLIEKDNLALNTETKSNFLEIKAQQNKNNFKIKKKQTYKNN